MGAMDMGRMNMGTWRDMGDTGGTWGTLTLGHGDMGSTDMGRMDMGGTPGDTDTGTWGGGMRGMDTE